MQPTPHGSGDHHAPHQPQPGSLESGLGFRVGRAHRTLRQDWERRTSDLGLSPPQAAMLRAVCEWPDSGLREVARRTRTDAMNAKRLADHLEQLGLVRSVTDPAHRQRRVLRPTEEGRVLAQEVGERAAAWNRHLSLLLGSAEFGQLLRLLERLDQVVATGPPPAPAREAGNPEAGAE